MFQFIQTQTAFQHVLDLMRQTSTYGLDTEFIKVDTLWPKLGLFQINIAGQVFLLDGTTLDLSEFWTQLFNAQQNIFHACSEDVDLIYHYAQKNNLKNVFDTQVGLAFLGHGLQVSYQNALKNMLNVDIDKDQTRSDWLARPLSAQQLEYAANDVIYLTQLSQKVQKELCEKNLYHCVLEDCQTLTQDIGAETPLTELYLDVGSYRHSRRQLMQLQQLCVWREQMVKALNQPRSFILKHSTMLYLVEKNPKNTFQLSQAKDIRQNIVREHGKTILDLLNFLPENTEWPLRIAHPIRHASKDIGDKVENFVEQLAQELDIPNDVLLRKKWLRSLYQHVVFRRDEQDLPAYLLGWRYEVLTLPLIQVLRQDEDYLSTQVKLLDSPNR